MCLNVVSITAVMRVSVAENRVNSLLMRSHLSWISAHVILQSTRLSLPYVMYGGGVLDKKEGDGGDWRLNQRMP